MRFWSKSRSRWSSCSFFLNTPSSRTDSSSRTSCRNSEFFCLTRRVTTVGSDPTASLVQQRVNTFQLIITVWDILPRTLSNGGNAFGCSASSTEAPPPGLPFQTQPKLAEPTFPYSGRFLVVELVLCSTGATCWRHYRTSPFSLVPPAV